MNILLVSRSTLLNKAVRKNTNSPWGHCSGVIEGIVYEFDYFNKAKRPLEEVLSANNVLAAGMFNPRLRDGAEEVYKDLFEGSEYDKQALTILKGRERDGEDIQTSLGKYTCSSLLAKVCYEHGDFDNFAKGIHWSQIAPGDFAKLEEYSNELD